MDKPKMSTTPIRQEDGYLPGNNGKRSVPLLVLLLLLILVFALDAYGTYAVLTSKIPGANDFYSRWAGAKIFLLEGKNPYSDEATQEIQRGMYGRLAKEGEDQVAFAYPMYVVYFVVPLVYLPYAQAEAIWLALLQFALLLGVFLGLRVYNWRPTPWVLAATCIWAVLFYNSARSILLGQFAVVVFALTALALWALRSHHDTLAGVCLALCTVKPQMAFLLVPLLLVWCVVRRRWPVVISFGVLMCFLMGSSLLLMPTWIADFFTWMSRYPSYTAIGSPVWIITNYYFPALGTPVHVLLIVALLAYLLWSWRGLAAWGWEELSWGVGMVLIVTNLIALRTATTNYVVLLLPLLMALRSLTHHVRWGSWGVIAFEVVSLIGFWVLFARTVVGKFEHPIMYLPLPILLFVAFVVARQGLTHSSLSVEGRSMA